MEDSVRLRERFKTSYQNLMQDSNTDKADLNAFEDARQRSLTRSSAWKTAESIVWFIGSLIILRYTDFILVLAYEPTVNRPWLYTGSGFLAIFILIGSWLIIWYNIILKVDDYQKRVPAAVPIATMSFLISFGCFTYALWPVYGFLTPLLLFTLMMGVVVTVSFF